MDYTRIIKPVIETAQFNASIFLIILALFFIAFLTFKKKTKKYAK